MTQAEHPQTVEGRQDWGTPEEVRHLLAFHREHESLPDAVRAYFDAVDGGGSPAEIYAAEERMRKAVAR